MYRCQNEDARQRPRLQYLYDETKLRMEKFRALARTEEVEALRKGVPGCFHSNILFKKGDRKRFETDAVFRSNYKKANLKPVWEIFGHLPHPKVVQAKPSIPLGEIKRLNVRIAADANANVRTGQQKGDLRAHADQRTGKSREKKKKSTRAPQGIRGLLSKLNFFS